jgi:hypothetical protein
MPSCGLVYDGCGSSVHTGLAKGVDHRSHHTWRGRACYRLEGSRLLQRPHQVCGDDVIVAVRQSCLRLNHRWPTCWPGHLVRGHWHQH